MSRALVGLVVGLVGCGPPARSEVTAPDAVPDSLPPFPDGAWEPDPGIGRTGAQVIADGADLWFVYARSTASPSSEVWLTKTTSSGTVLVPPMRVDTGPEIAAWPAAAARSGDNLAVVYLHSAGTLPPRVRMFDRTGQPARAMAQLIPLSTVTGTYITATALAARADGTMRLFAAHDDDMTTDEVVMVELDANGDPTGSPTRMGTADGGVPSHLTAAFAPDGTSVVAWDRVYDVCKGYFDPDATVATRIAPDGTATAVVDIQPLEPSDLEPSVATFGASGYVAWTSQAGAGSTIKLARTDLPTSTVAIVGNPAFGNYAPIIALAGERRGAIAWMTYEPAIRVAAFHDENGAFVVDAPHVIVPDPEGLFVLDGIVSVGGDRYVVSWTNEIWSASHSRLYALELDVSAEAKPTPDGEPAPPLPPRMRDRRCTH